MADARVLARLMPLPAKMTAIAISAPGGPEVLRTVELPVPQPSPDEVLIRVAAAGLNAPDVGQRRGSYPPPADASPLPGLEVAGEIVAVGHEVTGWSLGSPVMALTNGGGYAEFVSVPAGQVLPLPPGWTMRSGAVLPETFFTVEQTLVMRAGLEPGMHVLVHGAAGGIGGAAVQIARHLGAIPIAVVSDEAKARYALELGAAAFIRRDEEDFVARTLELTGGRGAERILDIVGGDTLDRNISAAARFGHIVLVSTIAGPEARINAARLLMKQLTLSGSTLRPQSRQAKAAIARHLLDHLWPALADGRIRSPRLTAFALADAPRAHAELERRDHYGKIVLFTPWGASLDEDRDNPIESA